VILGQKLTLNHPSLVNEEEEVRVFVTAHKREKRFLRKITPKKSKSIVVCITHISTCK